MITGIYTPCLASKLSAVETRIELLKMVGEQFPVGFEVVGPITDFTDPTQCDAIKVNLAKARESGVSKILIHAPVNVRENPKSDRTNLSSPESLALMRTVLDLASQVDANTITAHAEIFHSAAQMNNLTDAKRERLKELVAENLEKLDLENQPANLAIENMPYPLTGDLFSCQADMVFDPLFTDPFELYEFTQQGSAKITLDTCHWATLNSPISLLNMFKRIENRVVNIHLNDALGLWIDGTSRFKEGLIPGDGNLGEEQFRRFLSYLKTCERQFTLTLEVSDQDFKKIEESKETLKRVLAWLE